MKLIDRLLIKLRLRQLNADKKIVELVKEGIKKIKIEETKACDHSLLKKIIAKDLWYLCRQCKTVFFVHGAEGWNVKQIPILIKNLEEGLKLNLGGKNADSNSKRKPRAFYGKMRAAIDK